MERCFKRICVAICLLSTICVYVCNAKNHALLIGISQYSPKYNWNTISGTNDIDLIKGVLNGFSIRDLRNEKAIYNNY